MTKFDISDLINEIKKISMFVGQLVCQGVTYRRIFIGAHFLGNLARISNGKRAFLWILQ